MKILAISGSPRNGNSEFLLDTILNQAKENGNQTEKILIKEKNIQFCDGCLTCAGGKAPCPVKDDMQEIYEKIKNSDALLFASPVWYDMITPYLLNFIVRLNCVQANLKNKKFAFIVLGQRDGDYSDKSLGTASNYLKQIAKLYEMNLVDSLIIKGVRNEKDAKEKEEVIEKCKQLANKIIS
jgi:multimeric flavodoxin WrbA